MYQKISIVLIICVLLIIAFSGCDKITKTTTETIITSTTNLSTISSAITTIFINETTATKSMTTTAKSATKTSIPTTTSILSQYNITEYNLNINNETSNGISNAIGYGFSYKTVIDMIKGKKTKPELQSIKSICDGYDKLDIGGMSKAIDPLIDGFISLQKAEQIASKGILDTYSFQVSNKINNKTIYFYDNTGTKIFRDGTPDYTWEFAWFIDDKHINLYSCTLDARTGKIYSVHKKVNNDHKNKITTEFKNKLIIESLKKALLSQFSAKGEVDGIILTWYGKDDDFTIIINIYYKNNMKITYNNWYTNLFFSHIQSSPIVNE